MGEAALTINHPQEAEYVITYLTHFDLDLTAQNVNTNLNNKAWLQMNWDPDGAGPEPARDYGTPVIEKTTSCRPALLKNPRATMPRPAGLPGQ